MSVVDWVIHSGRPLGTRPRDVIPSISALTYLADLPQPPPSAMVVTTSIWYGLTHPETWKIDPFSRWTQRRHSTPPHCSSSNSFATLCRQAAEHGSPVFPVRDQKTRIIRQQLSPAAVRGSRDMLTSASPLFLHEPNSSLARTLAITWDTQVEAQFVRKWSSRVKKVPE